MSKEIEDWMTMYDFAPSLVLFNDMIADEHQKQEKAFQKIVEECKEELNPIGVVLESLVNVISEHLSAEKITSSEDKILVSTEIRQLAIDTVSQFIEKNPKARLKMLHQRWLMSLRKFTKDMSQKHGNIRIEEALFRICRRFRISGVSAIKGISAITMRKIT